VPSIEFARWGVQQRLQNALWHLHQLYILITGGSDFVYVNIETFRFLTLPAGRQVRLQIGRTEEASGDPIIILFLI
jgi:hypothetical protein